MAIKTTIGAWARRWVLGAAAGTAVLLTVPAAAYASQGDGHDEHAQARSGGKHVSQAKNDAKPARKKKHASKKDKAEKAGKEKGSEKLEKLPALSGADAAPKGDFDKEGDQVSAAGKDAAKEASTKKSKKDSSKKSKHGKTAKASHAKGDKKDEKTEKVVKPSKESAKKKNAGGNQ